MAWVLLINHRQQNHILVILRLNVRLTHTDILCSLLKVSVSAKRGVTANLNSYFVYLWSHDTAVCQARRIKNMTPRRGWSVQKFKRASNRKCFHVIMFKCVILSNMGRFICGLVSLMMICPCSHDTPESTAVKKCVAETEYEGFSAYKCLLKSI